MSHWERPGQSDEWFTPPHVFKALGCTFDVDVAAPFPKVSTHVPAFRRIWRDGCHDQSWSGFIWMNPPFGGRNSLEPWLDRFCEHGNGIALTPDRTSAPWFMSIWRRADLVMFTRKIRFLRPDGSEGKSPSNGTALFAIGDRAVTALRRADESGLGIIGTPMGKL